MQSLQGSPSVSSLGALDALPEGVKRCLAYLWQRSGDISPEGVSLAQLADVAGISAAELSAVFRRSLGLRPVEVLLMLRLERSLGLLENTTLPIAEVAAICGFRGAPHYFKVFWSAFSMAPLTYRSAARLGQAVRAQSPTLLGLLAQQAMNAGSPARR
jgi:transcriptional regulator GlxA family with amidase domain